MRSLKFICFVVKVNRSNNKVKRNFDEFNISLFKKGLLVVLVRGCILCVAGLNFVLVL